MCVCLIVFPIGPPGCGFPKFARDLSVQKDIRGWIKNSKKGTIMGKMQGRKEDVDQL